MSESKVAFITGATGIGAATAVELARRGIRVGVMARTREDIDAVVARVEEAGSEGLVLQGDVSNEDDLKRAYERIVGRWGRLDIVFANAGINGKWAPIDKLTLDDWNKVISINLTGTFLTVKHAVPHLKKHGGAIVITSSVNGTRMFSNTGASAYASTKAAQVAFAQMMALELAPDGIRVNVICPGAIATEIDESTEKEGFEAVQYPVDYPKGEVPLTHGEPGRAEDVARLVYFLVSDDARHVTGTPVWIDGAQSLFQG